jgi:pyrimidine-nucleoside phosphorylase
LRTVDARAIGQASVEMGAGRAKKGDPIDHAVGIVVHHKVGDRLRAGEVLFTLHANEPERLEAAKEKVLRAHRFSARKVKRLPLFYRVIRD